MSLLLFLVVGLVAGWLAGVLVKGGGFGLVGDLVVGVIGAFLGGLLFSSAGVSLGGGLVGSIVVATIGAIVLLLIVRLLKRA
ncbi:MULTISPECIES: GlsB/YeaQ/YmgE family stress response membrane protein [Variovorax]|uniref:GlsB/YeaQ/YmgE family stress response membrane protein n=1 Tax=Variovorax sp. MHTC-1 TaxID=2495593 RepID=UPI000F867D2A|nr:MULTISPECIES: GlsB/YeaQ/YmgE family stress response membrane protein [Variovorax]MBT2300934.1 GlsB/YeaQ/YmgE family stress response membrane protein [Variovorax paradoxus]RST55984.1 GlsB/YeaQ/YmgE family stress response membrane protein [Variovorax sp. MHTC-1]